MEAIKQMKFSDSKNPKGLDLRFVFFFYLMIALISVIWSTWETGNPIEPWTTSRPPGWSGLLAAAGFILIYVITSQIFTRIFEWARELEKMLGYLLTPLSYFQIIIIACLSGFIEEWFFRGILQGHFGIIISSLLFGACHFFPARRIWVWSIWSFFAGLGFAIIYQASESLWLCALTHFAVNAIGLILLNLRAYHQPSFRSLS